jgi:hypothetical protein
VQNGVLDWAVLAFTIISSPRFPTSSTSSFQHISCLVITRGFSRAELTLFLPLCVLNSASMCGNFGLLMLGRAATAGSPTAKPSDQSPTTLPAASPMSSNDIGIDNQMLEVSRHGGIRVARTESNSMNGRRATSIVIGKRADEEFDSTIILPPISILEAQTACTEIRGGQAGGYSCIEYKEGLISNAPACTRVRMVARKRHPLAADLSKLFAGKGGNPSASSVLTGSSVIC